MSKVIVPSSYHPTYDAMHQHAAANIDPAMVTKIEHSSPPHHSPYAEGDPLVDGYTGKKKWGKEIAPGKPSQIF
jgi:hypothetical protein